MQKDYLMDEYEPHRCHPVVLDGWIFLLYVPVLVEVSLKEVFVDDDVLEEDQWEENFDCVLHRLRLTTEGSRSDIVVRRNN